MINKIIILPTIYFSYFHFNTIMLMLLFGLFFLHNYIFFNYLIFFLFNVDLYLNVCNCLINVSNFYHKMINKLFNYNNKNFIITNDFNNENEVLKYISEVENL